MPARLRRVLLSLPVLIVGGLVGIYLLLAWLAFEPLVKWALPRAVADASGYRLQLDRASFNPFRLSVDLQGLALSDPAGQPLLSLARGVVNLDSTGLFTGTLRFDEVRLERPVAAVEIAPGGRLNWLAFIDALNAQKPASATPPKDGPLPRLTVRNFVLDQGRIDFSDATVPGGFKTRLDPLNLALDELSTLPNDEGHHAVSAQLATGAQLQWRGRFSLNPMAASGDLVLDNLVLASVWPYVERSLHMAPPEGRASLSLKYQAGYAKKQATLKIDPVIATVQGLRAVDTGFVRPLTAEMASFKLSFRADATAGDQPLDLNLQGLRVDASGIRLQSGADTAPWLQLGRVSVEDAFVKLASRELGVARVSVAEGGVSVVRDARGRLALAEAFERAAPSAASAASPAASSPPTAAAAAAAASAPAVATAASAAPPWRWRVGQAELSQLGLSLRDESVQPVASFVLEDIQAGAEGLGSEVQSSIPVRLGLNVKSGGRLELKGSVVPEPPSADLQLALRGLALAPVQPYLAQVAELKLAGGRVDTEGRVRYANGQPRYDGQFGLYNLAIQQAEGGENFLSWKHLATRRLSATPQKLGIGELELAGLDTRLVIFKDRTVNVVKAFHPKGARPSDASASAVAAAAPASAASGPSTAPAYQVDLERLRVVDSRLDFADLSLALPFAARIHKLNGQMVGVSTQPGRSTEVELAGQVDDYGLARAAGRVKLLDPTNAMDLKVIFQNVEMTSLTPYSATFAGRRIASGKLSLDLEYKIDQRQLKGDNKVVMDKLTLGERVESPTAVNLPLDLALAILQDRDGRIDLGLPVSGSLDDPQFSYGGIVWKALLNVLGKAITSPFRAIGALFGSGGGDESTPEIVFDPGSAELLPPEREKLDRLARALAQRPTLVLSVAGGYGAQADGDALKELQLRRTVARQMGRSAAADSELGPLNPSQPEVRQALEALFLQAFGAEALRALPRQAGAGSQPADATVLVRRLVERESLAEGQLATLAGERAEAVRRQLLAQGLAADRLQAGPAVGPDAAAKATPSVRLGLSLPAAAPPKP